MRSHTAHQEASSAHAIHKFLHHRGHGTKTSSHRYTRRRVREYLRHLDLVQRDELEFA